MQDISRNRRRV